MVPVVPVMPLRRPRDWDDFLDEVKPRRRYVSVENFSL
jgi:hypothetical protein